MIGCEANFLAGREPERLRKPFFARGHRTGILGAMGVAALAMLSACGAARPVKYFTLNPSPMPEPRDVENARFSAAIVVGRITANHLYRDDRIVYGTGGVELGTYEYNRWAEEPSEMLETMIVQTLRSKTEYRSVARMSSSMRGDYLLRGHLYSLEEIDNPALVARFSIALELLQIKTNTLVWKQSYTHDEAVPDKKMDAIVEAMRRNVDNGLNQLTDGIDQYFASHPAQ